MRGRKTGEKRRNHGEGDGKGRKRGFSTSESSAGTRVQGGQAPFGHYERLLEENAADDDDCIVDNDVLQQYRAADRIKEVEYGILLHCAVAGQRCQYRAAWQLRFSTI